MRKRLSITLAYLLLFLLSLPIPLLHHYRTDAAIERTRHSIKFADGKVQPSILFGEYSMLRLLGHLSQCVSVALIVLVALSFRSNGLARGKSLFVVACALCAFTTLYAGYVVLLLVTGGLRPGLIL